jgi:hypothetical protein
MLPHTSSTVVVKEIDTTISDYKTRYPKYDKKDSSFSEANNIVFCSQK